MLYFFFSGATSDTFMAMGWTATTVFYTVLLVGLEDVG